MNTDEIIKALQDDYDFVGKSYDKNGKYIGDYFNYSKTISLFPSQVEAIQEHFPDFKIFKLYNDVYNIGFNKEK